MIDDRRWLAAIRYYARVMIALEHKLTQPTPFIRIVVGRHYLLGRLGALHRGECGTTFENSEPELITLLCGDGTICRPAAQLEVQDVPELFGDDARGTRYTINRDLVSLRIIKVIEDFAIGRNLKSNDTLGRPVRCD